MVVDSHGESDRLVLGTGWFLCPSHILVAYSVELPFLQMGLFNSGTRRDDLHHLHAPMPLCSFLPCGSIIPFRPASSAQATFGKTRCVCTCLQKQKVDIMPLKGEHYPDSFLSSRVVSPWLSGRLRHCGTPPRSLASSCISWR